MQQLPELKAVLFDLDDTLLDRRSAYDVFFRAFYDRHEAINEEVSWPEAKEFFWSLSIDNATSPRDSFNTIRDRWPGVTGDPDSHYHTYFKALVANMKPLPGALELAETLNSRGMPWGVVTNGGQYQQDKVKATGLDRLVPFVIATELHGASKPDPEPFLHALRLLELDENESAGVLFVGDNPHTDIIGAHSVGMRTAWIHMGREFPAGIQQPHLTIGGVSELYETLGL